MDELRNAKVRILEVELNYFRNVDKGLLKFSEYSRILKGDFNNSPGILGIYGQNGSGKTAVIIVMKLLKDLILENPLDKQLFDNISMWSDTAMVKYTLLVSHIHEKYLIEYEVKLKKLAKSIVIDYEVLKTKTYLQKDNKWIKKLPVYKVDYNDEEIIDIFGLATKIENFDNKILMKTNVIKGICTENKTSLIFNQEIYDLLDDYRKNNDLIIHQYIIGALKYYVKLNLFIINNKDSSLITSSDMMNFNLRLENIRNNELLIHAGRIPVKLFESHLVPIDVYETIEQLTSEINIIMPTFLPNFSIEIVNLGSELMDDGNIGKKLEFVSVVNNHRIPLRNESEGTKKIVSICSALIAVYNNDTVCLCIDELDSGVFEYLLGQILKILSLGAKGQILFTSHNLRPLEVLGKDNIIVTTTNKNNRYIKLKNIKTTNNIRDFYLRGLLVGGQNEEIYKETDINDIARAFRRAGEIHSGITN